MEDGLHRNDLKDDGIGTRLKGKGEESRLTRASRPYLLQSCT